MTERENAAIRIDDAIRKIVEQFHPIKIILFGAHARGAAGPDSDVDLLVVMDVKDSKRRQAVEIDPALSDRTFPLDLIVVTPEEFEKYRAIVGHIVYPAVRGEIPESPADGSFFAGSQEPRSSGVVPSDFAGRKAQSIRGMVRCSESLRGGNTISGRLGHHQPS